VYVIPNPRWPQRNKIDCDNIVLPLSNKKQPKKERLTFCQSIRDAVFNFVRPHQALRIAVPQPALRRKWQQRTPAMAAELTDK
jgi:outer membrane usher protein FimD/PapC